MIKKLNLSGLWPFFQIKSKQIYSQTYMVSNIGKQYMQFTRYMANRANTGLTPGHKIMCNAALITCLRTDSKNVSNSLVQIILLFLYYQRIYSENSKIVICLDSFSEQMYNIWVIIRLISVFETTALLN